MNRLFIFLTLTLTLLGCNSEEQAKQKRENAIERYLLNIGIPFPVLTNMEHHYGISSIKQDSIALSLSLSTYKSYEELKSVRNKFVSQLNLNYGVHKIDVATLSSDNLELYRELISKLDDFSQLYNSLWYYTYHFKGKPDINVTALLNDWAYMDRFKYGWVFYFDEKNNFIGCKNYGHDVDYFLDRCEQLNTNDFIGLIEGDGLKFRHQYSSDGPISLVDSIKQDSIPFILTIERPIETGVETTDLPKKNEYTTKSIIAKTYYDLTIGKSSYSSTMKRIRNNRFKVIEYPLGKGIKMYSCVKKFKWNNITWDELDLYFKENILVGIAFAKVCNSENQAKHYLERVSYIYKDDYKNILTESSPDFLYFDDGQTAMEIYGGEVTMYLRICETSVADTYNQNESLINNKSL